MAPSTEDSIEIQKMEITREVLIPFFGGEIEFQNNEHSYVYHGEVDMYKVDNNILYIIFKWLGKGTIFPPNPFTEWEIDKTILNRFIRLKSCVINKIGPGKVGGTKILLESWESGEIITMFPADGEKINPALIKWPESDSN